MPGGGLVYWNIVALLTGQDDYTKTRNYLKYLKAKLKKEKNELVSATTQLKLLANDGKRYLTDTLDYTGIIALGKDLPLKKASRFIDWSTYSDESIDGKGKTKAYALFTFGKSAYHQNKRPRNVYKRD